MTRVGTSAFKVVIALSLLTIAVVFLANSVGFGFTSTTIDRSGPALLERIRTVEEFTAAEGNFIQDVDLENDTRFQFLWSSMTLPDFVSGERVVALVDGSVRAMVDFSNLDEDSIQVDEKASTIRITLPQPVLSDVDIDEKSVRIVARDRGFIDRVEDFFASNPTDDSPVFLAAEDMITEAAAESDLLDRGRASTEQFLRTFLTAAGFHNVNISWQ